MSGFSLLELSIVLTIVGTMLAAVFELTVHYTHTTKYDTTIQTLQRIDAAMQRYVVQHGALPCPANRGDAPDSANYGISVNCGAPSAGTVSVGAGNSAIRIGVVPVRSLNLPDNLMFDAWHMRITYTVVENLAMDSATFDAYTKPAADPITIQDRYGNSVIDAGTGSDMLAAYAFISHGANKNGATVKRGDSINACIATLDDAENCDTDAFFIDTPVANSGISDFDDLLLWVPHYQINPALR